LTQQHLNGCRVDFYWPERFTRAQVRFEPDHVRHTLVAVAERLGAAG
jgi:hypothetical protein